MDKVALYVLDTRKSTLTELLELSHLSDVELQSLEKYKAIEVKKEKIVSLYFRNKYIGETYVMNLENLYPIKRFLTSLTPKE